MPQRGGGQALTAIGPMRSHRFEFGGSTDRVEPQDGGGHQGAVGSLDEHMKVVAIGPCRLHAPHAGLGDGGRMPRVYVRTGGGLRSDRCRRAEAEPWRHGGMGEVQERPPVELPRVAVVRSRLRVELVAVCGEAGPHVGNPGLRRDEPVETRCLLGVPFENLVQRLWLARMNLPGQVRAARRVCGSVAARHRVREVHPGPGVRSVVAVGATPQAVTPCVATRRPGFPEIPCEFPDRRTAGQEVGTQCGHLLRQTLHRPQVADPHVVRCPLGSLAHPLSLPIRRRQGSHTASGGGPVAARANADLANVAPGQAASCRLAPHPWPVGALSGQGRTRAATGGSRAAPGG